MPSIRFIQTTGAGFDSVDHLTAAELGIPVSNSPNMNASSVAEYVMAAIINLQRGLTWADGEIRRGRYAASRAELLEQGGLELRGCRIGLFGLGNIGRRGRPARQGFWVFRGRLRCFWPEGFAAENGIERMDVADLFAECDVVSLHCPLNGSTRNLVDYNLLSTMKPHALLINAARSGVVVEADLARILAEGGYAARRSTALRTMARRKSFLVHSRRTRPADAASRGRNPRRVRADALSGAGKSGACARSWPAAPFRGERRVVRLFRLVFAAGVPFVGRCPLLVPSLRGRGFVFFVEVK